MQFIGVEQRVRTAGRTVKCRECENTFTLSEGEIDFYIQKKGLALPRRCIPCRRARRERETKAARTHAAAV